MIEEKKLTDEEIVKALKCCVKEEHKDCVHCGEFVSQFDCMRNAISNALDLIHRLQDENAGLKERGEKIINELHKTIDAKKAEIERLTEEKTKSAETAVEVLEQNIELQKQVDELKERAKIDLEHERVWGKIKTKQTVKDTAKEILDLIKSSEYVDSLKTISIWAVEKIFKERYGVEVE